MNRLLFSQGLKWLPEIFAILGALALCVYFLFIPPLIGMGDNGDFIRPMKKVGLAYAHPPENRELLFFGYFHHLYRYKRHADDYQHTSTLVPVVALAVFLDKFFTKDGFFDIRWLSGLYTLLFLGAVALFMRALRPLGSAVRWAGAFLFLFIFADVGYLAYFNSLYGEPLAYLSFLYVLLLAWHLLHQAKPSLWPLLSYLLAIVLLVGSKTQYIPSVFAFALMTGLFAYLRPESRAFRWTAILGAVATLLLAGFFFVKGPAWLKRLYLYQSVFYGILNFSPDVKADLQALGLDPKLAVNAGYHFFRPAPIPQQSEEMQQQFFSRVSRWDVVRFYLQHPRRLLAQMGAAATRAFTIRPPYLGNYEPSAGKPYRAQCTQWALWSDVKRFVIPNHWVTLASVFAAFAVTNLFFFVRAWKSGDRRLALVAIFWLVFVANSLLQWIVPFVADGFADFEKHMFLFNVSFDAVIVVSLLFLVKKLAKTVIALQNHLRELLQPT
ncbi:MAG: glycan biosynthesis hexose transferase WsfD [Thermoanaerobaculaceae bacterium]